MLIKATAVNPYIPVLIILVFGIVLGLIMTAMSHWLGPRKPTAKKQELFECGVPVLAGQDRMSVKFYLTGLLFILFDIETIFLYLWAKAFRSLGFLGFIEILIFMVILVAGYVYVIKRGALEWES